MKTSFFKNRLCVQSSLVLILFTIIFNTASAAPSKPAEASDSAESTEFWNCAGLDSGGILKPLPGGGEQCCTMATRSCVVCVPGQPCRSKTPTADDFISRVVSPQGNTATSGAMAPTNPPTLPPGTPPTFPPNPTPEKPPLPPTKPLVAPAIDKSQRSTGIRMPTGVMQRAPITIRAAADDDDENDDDKDPDVVPDDADCGKAGIGSWGCTTKDDDGNVTGSWICSDAEHKKCVKMLVGKVRPPIMERQNMGNDAMAPATSSKPIMESPKDKYTPIGSRELPTRMKAEPVVESPADEYTPIGSKESSSRMKGSK